MDRPSRCSTGSAPVRTARFPLPPYRLLGCTLIWDAYPETVSTKYLCVSGPSATFPAWDWKRMSGHEAKPFASEDQTCFIARTSAWDPFIVYAVDPHRPSAAADSLPPPPSPIAGYPRPPINALPVNPAAPTPIYYNQPIVLQCLATGVISPIMIIRRVDKGTAATGGGSIDGPQPFVSLNLPVAPGETLGDPVSQLHKIALEIMDNPAAAYGSPMSSYLDGFSGSGTFLACLGENVGIHRATEGRKPLGPPNGGGYPSATPPLSASSSATGQSIGSSLSTPYPESMHFGSLQEADFEGVDTKPSISFNGRLSNLSAVPSPSSRGSLAGGSTRIPLSMPLEPPSSDGGKVRRPRRVSSSVVLGAAGGAGAKVKGGGRRRGASMSVVNTLGDFDDAWTSSKNDLPGYHMPPPINLWTIECAEPSVWTIVGTGRNPHSFEIWIAGSIADTSLSRPVPEIARHTFYVPPTIYGGRSANAGSMEIEPSPLFSTPIPATPLNPIPSVQKFHLTQPSPDDRVRLGALGQEYVDIEHVLSESRADGFPPDFDREMADFLPRLALSYLRRKPVAISTCMVRRCAESRGGIPMFRSLDVRTAYTPTRSSATDDTDPPRPERWHRLPHRSVLLWSLGPRLFLWGCAKTNLFHSFPARPHIFPLLSTTFLMHLSVSHVPALLLVFSSYVGHLLRT